MTTTFRPCAPDQSLLFPPSPRDWLPEGHLAFFIADTVAAVDLQASIAVSQNASLGDGHTKEDGAFLRQIAEHQPAADDECRQQADHDHPRTNGVPARTCRCPGLR